MTDEGNIQLQQRSRRGLFVGIGGIIVAVLIFLPTLGADGGNSTFVLESQRAGVIIAAPDLVFPTNVALYILAVLAAFIGLWQFARGFKNETPVIVSIAVVAIIAFLV